MTTTVADTRIVISASRRTDIPAFYMPWFMGCIQQGYFEAVNPYNRKRRVVAAGADAVHSLVFWSKDFGAFLAGGYGRTLQKQGYRQFFQFTLNGERSVLEPGLSRLDVRLAQLGRLVERYFPKAVMWRFDPITFYTGPSGESHHNLTDFERIARSASGFGIQACTTSFKDVYPKVVRRESKLPGIRFIDPSMEAKVPIILQMEKILQRENIRLYLCCEKDLLAALPVDSQVAGASCISSRRLNALFGGKSSNKRDTGQRASMGCGCSVSVDVGDYQTHPCLHGCRYCYANPVLSDYVPEAACAPCESVV